VVFSFGLEGEVPDHSTFSRNRHGRFRESDVLRFVFDEVVRACMREGLVKGEGFAIDASLMPANANWREGVAPDEVGLCIETTLLSERATPQDQPKRRRLQRNSPRRLRHQATPSGGP